VRRAFSSAAPYLVTFGALPCEFVGRGRGNERNYPALGVYLKLIARYAGAALGGQGLESGQQRGGFGDLQRVFPFGVDRVGLRSRLRAPSFVARDGNEREKAWLLSLASERGQHVRWARLSGWPRALS
jgi:hypothetical protein